MSHFPLPLHTLLKEGVMSLGVGYRRWKSHTVYHVRQKGYSRWLKFCLIAVCAVYLLGYVQKRTLPMFYDLVENKIRDIGTEMTEHSIMENELIGTVSYEKLITKETDDTGKVLSLAADGSLLNQIRTSLIDSILKKMDVLRESYVTIPLGSFSGNPFFAGTGPDVPIRIIPYGSVDINFQSLFTSAGVNQTKHEVNMVIHINMNAFFPGKTLDVNLDIPVLLTQTIIAGEVPRAYLDHMQNLEELGQIELQRETGEPSF